MGGPRCSRSGSREVSFEARTAQSETSAAATRYQAGERLLPVQEMSSVATNAAVPPKRAFARLKLMAKPL
ncbi:hypothetical protein [Streptomyces sp. NPDC001292]|uniref:hypothetical protein n=1 Tax=Streptomyces sp. NPDC001292 TaxID=3364558 RepID=UPI0036B3EB5C